MILFKNLHEVIELAKENAELKRGIGDIFLFIDSTNRGKEHIAIINDYSQINAIYNALQKWKAKIEEHK